MCLLAYIEQQLPSPDNASYAANLSTVVGVVVAIAAGIATAIYAALQIAASKESAAKEIYRSYLQLAFEHPDLSYPVTSGITSTREKPDHKYEWFVSYMLGACEEILAIRKRNSDWDTCVRLQLSYHKPYLASPYFRDEELAVYDEALRHLIKAECPPPEAPANG